MRRPVSPGTPFGVPGHVPHVPMAAGEPPWCSCGYRHDPSDPSSPLVGEHIQRIAAATGQPIDTPGTLE